MKNDLIKINGSSLPVREYEGKRVVTITDIAKVHNQSRKTIKNNFHNNRKQFIEGVDYFRVKGSATQNLGFTHKVVDVNVFTESGYLMLVKSLTDDLSWQVQRELVNGYFKGQGQRQINHSQGSATIAKVSNIVNLFPLLQEEFKQIIYYRVEKQLTQKETAKILGISSHKLWKMEMRLRAAGINLPPVRNNSSKFQLKNYTAFLALEA